MSLRLAALALLLLSQGCISARIHAESVRYPVSLSSTVVDSNHVPMKATPVKTFSVETTRFRTLWGVIPLYGRSWDVSEELNDVVREAGGNAIRNLKLRSEGCVTNSFVPLNLVLALWPYCAIFTLTGEVVKAVPAPPAPPAHVCEGCLPPPPPLSL